MNDANLWMERFRFFHDWVFHPGLQAATGSGSGGSDGMTPISDVPTQIGNLAKSLCRAPAVGVSACLLGIPCRYDGASRPVPGLTEQLAMAHLDGIPVCPEVLAGLGTPRPPMDFVGGDGSALLSGRAELVDIHGVPCSRAMMQGAVRALTLVEGVRALLLKERSPSCGVREIHLGSKVVSGRGVFAAMASQRGMALFCEEDLDSFFRFTARPS